MILDNTKKFKGFGYVCFIDVLGFSNDILKNWKRETSNPLDKILSVKKRIPGFTHNGNDDDSNILANYTCRVNTISDSFTICFGFKDDMGYGILLLD